MAPDQTSLPTRPADPSDFEGLAGGFNLLEYLDEFRRRLVYSALAVAVGFGVAVYYVQALFDAWLAPLQALVPGGMKFIATEPTEAFIVQLQMAAIAGLVLALPVVLFQLWRLASPALRRLERGYGVPFVLAATALFFIGAAFSHAVVFPYAWRFLGGFSTDYMHFRPRIKPTFSLYFRMMLAFGFVFQLPSFVFLLARMGLATPQFLARNFKYAVLLAFVVSAVITPTPDLMTQSLLAGPMIVLYVFSIGVAWLFKKRRDPEP
jgi:sec-independent protein translocase protein TatC